ncbi:hypothetical protein L195_g022406 [Trifolium pratense]|uniref:Uncharacterized protein n=1 Tax=Trifolium pratense TaxID=57577 RepID=A0A2K3N7W1_TRIPR|nr:hypothetical protein L195_g022406 [Trifolium pratense]
MLMADFTGLHPQLSWRSSSIPPKNHLLNLPSKFPYPSESWRSVDGDYGRYLHSTELGINIFCLDKQQILPLLFGLHRCSNLFWPPPQWTGLD